MNNKKKYKYCSHSIFFSLCRRNADYLYFYYLAILTVYIYRTFIYTVEKRKKFIKRIYTSFKQE